MKDHPLPPSLPGKTNEMNSRYQTQFAGRLGSFIACPVATKRTLTIFGASILVWIASGGNVQSQDRYSALRERLVATRIASAGVTDARVLDAIRNTQRHYFVPQSERDRAYLDMALPIGSSQTISSPFIVASMTEALQTKPTDKVLEIGTGSGYQAAVLSPLVDHVYSIEIVRPLGETAKETLNRLGYENVSTRIGDGFLGWPEAAPFDKIIVTCSPESVPQPLIDQLAEGGMMVVPVGQRYQQTLYRMTKKDGKLVRQPLRPTLFVPMTGEAEDKRQNLPDPAKPEVVNGDFETAPTEAESQLTDFVPGWYYGRQVTRVEASDDSSDSETTSAFARFENETPGLSSHLLQGIAIDGRKVKLIRLQGKARTNDVKKGPSADAMPMIAISLYDSQRRDLGTFWIGPFRGTRSWRESSRLIRVPQNAREAILRVGLFGATGTADFDDISLKIID